MSAWGSLIGRWEDRRQLFNSSVDMGQVLVTMRVGSGEARKKKSPKMVLFYVIWVNIIIKEQYVKNMQIIIA